jgi:hypothetical protein
MVLEKQRKEKRIEIESGGSMFLLADFVTLLLVAGVSVIRRLLNSLCLAGKNPSQDS